VRDVGLAEELAQDALVAALEQWPAEGIPARPGAWLMLTAKHRAIYRIRRDERLAGKLRPVVQSGAVIMDRIFDVNEDS
jgi:predicted RNA polymerase sigma factor